MARYALSGRCQFGCPLFLEARNAFTGFLTRNPARVEAVQIFCCIALGKLEQQGFRIGNGAGGGSEECGCDLAECGIHLCVGVNAMNQAGNLGLFGAEAVAGEQIASHESRAEGGQEDRHQRRRRESQPHFGNGEERIRCRQNHVTRARKAEPAADAGALHDGDGRFGKRIEPIAGAVDGGIVAIDRPCVSCQIGADIRTAAEVFAFPAQNNDPNRGVGIQSIQRRDQQRERLTIQRIAFVRTVQRNRDSAAQVGDIISFGKVIGLASIRRSLTNIF